MENPAKSGDRDPEREGLHAASADTVRGVGTALVRSSDGARGPYLFLHTSFHDPSSKTHDFP